MGPSATSPPFTPSATDPSAADPSATAPSATDPSATDPSATSPSATDPSAAPSAAAAPRSSVQLKSSQVEKGAGGDVPEPPVIASLAADTERVRVYAAVPEDTVACRDCKPLPADDDESADSPRAAIRQELQEGEDRAWRDRV